MNFIDLFSGAGGMRIGLERAGHKCVGFCEFDKQARKTYKAVFDTQGEWEGYDIRTVNSIDIPRAELWCYGFPCVGISIAGKMRGVGRKAEDTEADERSNLFFQVIRLLAGMSEETRPEWLLCENVKNLLSIDRGYALARILYSLDEMGYDSEWQLFNTTNSYVVGGEVIEGIPQNRERVYIISHLRNRGRRQVFPIARASEENTVRLQQIGRLNTDTRNNSNRCRVYSKNGISPTLNCMKGENIQPFVTVKTYAVITPNREEKRQQGRRMKEDGEPMFTLTAQDKHGVMIQKNDISIRKLTPKECWRLQGWCLRRNDGTWDDSLFEKAKAVGVSDSQLYKQAGNGCSANITYAIGLALKERVEKNE